MFFSKSRYCGFCQCPKIIWLKKYKPEEYIKDEAAYVRISNGTNVGLLAHDLFGEYVDATVLSDDGKLDIASMLIKTKEHIKNNTSVICEAAFEYNGAYCALDILKRESDGSYSIYEVKSSTDSQNHIYIVDVSYQKYILQKCGLKIKSVNIVNINNEYIFDGTLDIHKLFKITNLDRFVDEEIVNVENNLIEAEKILKLETEPSIDLSMGCNSPYKCGFWNYCTRHLPKPSVFDVYGTHLQDKLDFYYNHIHSFEDLLNTGNFLGHIQNLQLTHATQDLPDYIDKNGIKKFLNDLTFPLYFLDFESMQLIVPEFVGTRPYQQIAFQYSLHYIERKNGRLRHKEFLAESGVDPRRQLAENLCKDIPKNVCVLAYNKSFECGRINELAEMFPDLKEHLMNISMNIKDLIIPFKSGYCYNKQMGNSFSIKSVLPALFPNDPELDYHNLNGVHNGTEAMCLYPQLKDMTLDERVRARANLLKYCELDTFAMVKIYKYLESVCK